MGDIDEGIAAAEAEAPIGIAAMKSILMVGMVLAEGMMTGNAIMKVGAGGIGAQALAIGEGEAEVQVEDRFIVLSGKVVRRDEPKLSSGTGKEKCKKMLVKNILMATTEKLKLSMMVISKMVTNTVDMSSSHLQIKETMYTDLLNSMWFISLPISVYIVISSFSLDEVTFQCREFICLIQLTAIFQCAGVVQVNPVM